MFDIFFFLPIIVFVISLVILFIDKLIDDSINKKYMILVCSSVITVLSVFIFSNNYEDNEKLKSLSNENRELNKKNIELTELNSKLISTNKSITEDVRNWFTGSDSFCFLGIVDNNKLKVFSKGKFPVRDVYVRIGDYYYYYDRKKLFELKAPRDYEKTIEYVKYNVPKTLSEINLKDYVHNNKFSLIIFFETRNNSFTQTLSGEFVDGKLTKITNDSICKSSGNLTNLSKNLSMNCNKPNFVWKEEL